MIAGPVLGGQVRRPRITNLDVTGEERWRPIGNRAFAQLRRAIRAGRMLETSYARSLCR